MSRIIDVIKSKADIIYGDGCTEGDVSLAEKELEICFSEEYKDYLKTFQIAAFDGHELTGLTSSERVNVVDVTKKELMLNKLVPRGLYVIERTDVEDIIIWQDREGAIYYTTINTKPIKIYESLCEYIEKN